MGESPGTRVDTPPAALHSAATQFAIYSAAAPPEIPYSPLQPRSEDILLSCSSDNDSIRTVERKRKRRKLLGQDWVQGRAVFLVSTALRGPIDADWVNPWAKMAPKKHKKKRQSTARGSSPIDLTRGDDTGAKSRPSNTKTIKKELFPRAPSVKVNGKQAKPGPTTSRAYNSNDNNVEASRRSSEPSTEHRGRQPSLSALGGRRKDSFTKETRAESRARTPSGISRKTITESRSSQSMPPPADRRSSLQQLREDSVEVLPSQPAGFRSPDKKAKEEDIRARLAAAKKRLFECDDTAKMLKLSTQVSSLASQLKIIEQRNNANDSAKTLKRKASSGPTESPTKASDALSKKVKLESAPVTTTVSASSPQRSATTGIRAHQIGAIPPKDVQERSNQDDHAAQQRLAKLERIRASQSKIESALKRSVKQENKNVDSKTTPRYEARKQAQAATSSHRATPSIPRTATVDTKFGAASGPGAAHEGPIEITSGESCDSSSDDESSHDVPQTGTARKEKLRSVKEETGVQRGRPQNFKDGNDTDQGGAPQGFDSSSVANERNETNVANTTESPFVPLKSRRSTPSNLPGRITASPLYDPFQSRDATSSSKNLQVTARCEERPHLMATMTAQGEPAISISRPSTREGTTDVLERRSTPQDGKGGSQRPKVKLLVKICEQQGPGTTPLQDTVPDLSAFTIVFENDERLLTVGDLRAIVVSKFARMFPGRLNLDIDYFHEAPTKEYDGGRLDDADYICDIFKEIGDTVLAYRKSLPLSNESVTKRSSPAPASKEKASTIGSQRTPTTVKPDVKSPSPRTTSLRTDAANPAMANFHTAMSSLKHHALELSQHYPRSRSKSAQPSSVRAKREAARAHKSTARTPSSTPQRHDSSRGMVGEPVASRSMRNEPVEALSKSIGHDEDIDMEDETVTGTKAAPPIKCDVSDSDSSSDISIFDGHDRASSSMLKKPSLDLARRAASVEIGQIQTTAIGETREDHFALPRESNSGQESEDVDSDSESNMSRKPRMASQVGTKRSNQGSPHQLPASINVPEPSYHRRSKSTDKANAALKSALRNSGSQSSTPQALPSLQRRVSFSDAKKRCSKHKDAGCSCGVEIRVPMSSQDIQEASAPGDLDVAIDSGQRPSVPTFVSSTVPDGFEIIDSDSFPAFQDRQAPKNASSEPRPREIELSRLPRIRPCFAKRDRITSDILAKRHPVRAAVLMVERGNLQSKPCEGCKNRGSNVFDGCYTVKGIVECAECLRREGRDKASVNCKAGKRAPGAGQQMVELQPTSRSLDDAASPVSLQRTPSIVAEAKAVASATRQPEYAEPLPDNLVERSPHKSRERAVDLEAPLSVDEPLRKVPAQRAHGLERSVSQGPISMPTGSTAITKSSFDAQHAGQHVSMPSHNALSTGMLAEEQPNMSPSRTLSTQAQVDSAQVSLQDDVDLDQQGLQTPFAGKQPQRGDRHHDLPSTQALLNDMSPFETDTPGNATSVLQSVRRPISALYEYVTGASTSTTPVRAEKQRSKKDKKSKDRKSAKEDNGQKVCESRSHSHGHPAMNFNSFRARDTSKAPIANMVPVMEASKTEQIGANDGDQDSIGSADIERDLLDLGQLAPSPDLASSQERRENSELKNSGSTKKRLADSPKSRKASAKRRRIRRGSEAEDRDDPGDALVRSRPDSTRQVQSTEGISPVKSIPKSGLSTFASIHDAQKVSAAFDSTDIDDSLDDASTFLRSDPREQYEDFMSSSRSASQSHSGSRRSSSTVQPRRKKAL